MALESGAIVRTDASFNHFLDYFRTANLPGFVKQSEARDESKLIAEASAFTEVRPSSFRRDLLVEHKTTPNWMFSV